MAWLEELAYEDDGPPTLVDVKITDKHFKSAAGACNENTSASPSGFGYVVWKACGLSPAASRVHSTMMPLPFEHGFAPSRWRQCLEVMLEKQPGNPLIHRLRIIVLLEADFNIALRIIWMRRLFPAAEKMGFAKEQWGSRKNRNFHRLCNNETPHLRIMSSPPHLDSNDVNGRRSMLRQNHYISLQCL